MKISIAAAAAAAWVAYGACANALTVISSPSSAASFELDNIAVAPVVPEPATWAMLITGFGVLGGVARRRQRAMRLAAAF